jgi:hypothetical protein
MGLRTLHEGYLTLRILRNPLLADSLTLPPELRQAFVDGISTNPAAVPVAVAQLLLGGFLLATSVVTLFGGARSVNFALQALAANAALAAAGHVLGEPLQHAIASALLASGELSKDLPPEVRPEQVQAAFRWGFRLLLAAQCLMFGLLAWILSRPKARAFLAFSPAGRNEN